MPLTFLKCLKSRNLIITIVCENATQEEILFDWSSYRMLEQFLKDILAVSYYPSIITALLNILHY